MYYALSSRNNVGMFCVVCVQDTARSSIGADPFRRMPVLVRRLSSGLRVRRSLVQRGDFLLCVQSSLIIYRSGPLRSLHHLQINSRLVAKPTASTNAIS
jgi:hypothetical protein